MDAVEGMSRLPHDSVDLVFADPPWNGPKCPRIALIGAKRCLLSMAGGAFVALGRAGEANNW